jgi:hypothetical protein
MTFLLDTYSDIDPRNHLFPLMKHFVILDKTKMKFKKILFDDEAIDTSWVKNTFGYFDPSYIT